jgi:serine/threonine protein kinase
MDDRRALMFICHFLQLRDLRHDNLNAFIGACTEPPNICIITEYCSRGSLKDVLENDDVKLDNMFIASLVFDLIRVNLDCRLDPGDFLTFSCPPSGHDFPPRLSASLPR